MIKYKTRMIRYLVLCFVICLSIKSFSQQYASKEALKEQAEKSFKDGDFAKAMPLYAHLLSLNPTNGTYSYKYGVCLLKANDDKDKAISFLKFAISHHAGIPDVYFYLGRAYHLSYYFKKAIGQYEKYKSLAGKSDIEKHQVDLKIQMCKNGLDLLSHIIGVKVLDRKVVPENGFFRAYSLDDIGGQIVTIPKALKTHEDIKHNNNAVIYIPNNSRIVFYASYGNNKEKDIFKINRLPNGKWGKPVDIGSPVNTQYDEDFPFYNEATHTLYFCSKGHNSMGGYDIFKSIYDPESNTFSVPVNLDFSFSSAADDYLFITNPSGELAYFTSNRNSKAGEVTVYHVSVKPQKVDFVAISGTFIDNTDPKFKSGKIEVEGYETHKVVGEYTANSETGNYLLLLPGRGGKYKFTVSSTNNEPVHQGIVEVPEVDSLVTLRQKLVLVGKGDAQKLIIKNLFDQRAKLDMSNPAIAGTLQEKANLKVNTTKEKVLAEIKKANEMLAATKAKQSGNTSNSNPANDTELADNTGGENNATENKNVPAAKNNAANKNKMESSSPKPVESKEIAAQAQKRGDSMKAYIKNLKQKTNLSYKNADEFAQKALDLNQKSESVKNNPDEALSLKKEAATNANKAEVSLSLAKALQNELSEKQSDLAKVGELSKAIQSAISKGNKKEAIAKADEQKKVIANSKELPTGSELEKERLQREISEKEPLVADAKNNLAPLKEQKDAIDKKIATLNKELQNTDRKNKKDELSKQIDGLNLDKSDIDFQYAQADSNTTKLENELALAKLHQKILNDQITNLASDTKNPSASEVSEKAIGSDEIAQINNRIDELEDAGIANKTPEQIKEASKVENVQNDSALASNNQGVSNSSSENNNIQPTDNNQNQIASVDTTITSTQAPSNQGNEKTAYVGITDSNGKPVNINKKYTERLSATAAIEDKNTRDSTKLKTLSDWNSTLKEDVAMKEMAYSESNNQNEKSSIQAAVQVEKNKMDSIQNQITVIKSSQQQLIAQTQGANNEAQPLNETEQQTVSQNTANNPNIAAVEQNYTDAQLMAQTEKASQMSEKAEELQTEANKKKAAAENATNGAKKRQLLAEARKDSLDAQNLTFKAAAIQTSVNEKQININQGRLNALTSTYSNSTNTAVIVASAKANKAESYRTDLLASKTPNEDQNNLSNIQDIQSKQGKVLRSQTLALLDFKKALGNTEYLEAIAASNNQPTSSSESQNVTTVAQVNTNNHNATQEIENLNEETQNPVKNVQNTTISAPETNNESHEAAKLNADTRSNVQKMMTLNMQTNELKNKADSIDNIIKSGKVKKKESKQLAIKADSLNQVVATNNTKIAAMNRQKDSLNQQAALQEQQYINSTVEDSVKNDLKLSNKEQAIADTLSQKAITNIASSVEYKAYFKNKKSSRRLIKTAVVLYEESNKLKEQAQEALKLSNTLKAFQGNATTPEEKQKFVVRVKVMKEMAALKQKRSDSLSTLASEKLNQGKSDSAKAQSVLKSYKNAEVIYVVEKMNELNPNSVPITASQQELAENSASTANTAENKETNEANIQNVTPVNTNSAKESQNNRNSSPTIQNVVPVTPANTSTQNENETGNIASNENNNSLTSTQETENNQQPNAVPVKNQSDEIQNTETNQPPQNNTKNVEEATKQAPNTNINPMQAKKITKAVFSIMPSNKISAYNNQNPIPQSKPREQGLVYKVQIGAFRDPIPENLFKGFRPISKKTGRDGITRYWAGIFVKLDNAKTAKNEIHKLGYKDAFVVVFYNGKRITFAQARAIEAGKGINNPQTNNAIAQTKPENQSTNANTESSTPATNTSGGTEVNTSGKISHIAGIFFTVQVGVYKEPVRSGKLLSISPLSSIKTSNGFLRYSTGIYKTKAEADKRRSEVLSIVHDAFVTAYYKGKRIGVAKALQILAGQK